MNQREYRFACTQCSRCCRYESGYVFLTKTDLRRLAEYLKTSEQTVIDDYCTWVPMGGIQQLSLREQRANHDCVCWTDGGCSVYPARPLQCRTYPFWRHIVDESGGWLAESRTCPGIGCGPVWKMRTIRAALRDRAAESPVSSTRAASNGADPSTLPASGGSNQ